MVLPEEYWSERPPRKRFSEEEKRYLLKEQGGKCMYCGRNGLKLGIGSMEVDHKKPWREDGSNRKNNLQVLCHECNKRKTGKTDQQFRKDYERILPKRVPHQKPSPPAKPIPQSKFREVAREIAAEKAKRNRARRRRDDDLPTWPSW